MGRLSAQRLQEVFERQEVESFIDLLDPDVTWTWWEPEPACHNREEVTRRIEELLREGQWGRPEIVAQRGDRIVVDPRPDPPFELAPEIHHVYTFSGDRIVRMEDYPDRRAALEAVGLS